MDLWQAAPRPRMGARIDVRSGYGLRGRDRVHDRSRVLAPAGIPFRSSGVSSNYLDLGNRILSGRVLVGLSLDQAIEENELFDAGGMIYIKSILVGLGAVGILLVLPIGIIFVSAIAIVFSGSAVIGVLLAGVVVFAVGFAWEFRRSLRKASTR